MNTGPRTLKFCPACGSELPGQSTRPDQRIACTRDGCDFVHWNNPVPVVAALLHHNGKYIIARNALWPKRLYSLISGYVEPREHVEDAVLREVNEELGLDGTLERFLGHFTFGKMNQLVIAFEVTATGTIELNDEIAEIRQLSGEELKQYDFRPLTITEQIIRAWSGQS